MSLSHRSQINLLPLNIGLVFAAGCDDVRVAECGPAFWVFWNWHLFDVEPHPRNMLCMPGQLNTVHQIGVARVPVQAQGAEVV